MSAFNLYTDLCKLLPSETAEQLEILYKNAQVSTEDKVRALLMAIPDGKFIVLLDNFEDLLNPQTRDIVDTELDEILRASTEPASQPYKDYSDNPYCPTRSRAGTASTTEKAPFRGRVEVIRSREYSTADGCRWQTRVAVGSSQSTA